MSSEEEMRLLLPIARFLEAHGYHQAKDEWYLDSNWEYPSKGIIVLDKIEESRDIGTLGELSQMTQEQLAARLVKCRGEGTDILRNRIEEALIYVQEALHASSRLDIIKNIEQVKDILEGK
jgi:hypothetical protein